MFYYGLINVQQYPPRTRTGVIQPPGLGVFPPFQA